MSKKRLTLSAFVTALAESNVTPIWTPITPLLLTGNTASDIEMTKLTNLIVISDCNITLSLDFFYPENGILRSEIFKKEEMHRLIHTDNISVSTDKNGLLTEDEIRHLVLNLSDIGNFSLACKQALLDHEYTFIN